MNREFQNIRIHTHKDTDFKTEPYVHSCRREVWIEGKKSRDRMIEMQINKESESEG